MLDLIDDAATIELREKSSRIRFGKLPVVRRFQVDVIQVGKGGTAERRLAGLAGPGYRDKTGTAERVRPGRS